MKRFLTQTALTATLATFAFAQAPSTPTQTQITNEAQATPGQSATTIIPGSGEQRFRGVLMDASCQAIQTRGTSSTISDASRSRETPSATSQPSTPSTSTPTTASTNIGATTPNPAGTVGAGANTTSAAATGVNPDHPGQTPPSAVPPAEARSTASASGVGVSGSSSVTTYSGATGTAGTNTPASTEAAATGQRSRSADTSTALSTDTTSAGPGWTTAREKYKDCKVTSTTSSFALMSNGRIYMIDDTNGALRQKVSAPATAEVSDAPSRDWHSVSVTGNIEGDRIRVSSVQ
jgi:hypothetical protein